jgi:hypothetical protein
MGNGAGMISMEIIKMSWNEFEKAALDIAKQIKKSNAKISNIYGQPRGGLILAVRLSHLLKKPLIDKSYFADEDTLWVDDIVDSGSTAHIAMNRWITASLYCNLEGSYIPDFYSIVKPKDSWIEFPWEVKESD